MSPALANETLRLKAGQLETAWERFLLTTLISPVTQPTELALLRRAFDAGARAIIEGMGQ
jgi:hypothetical protein